MPRRGSKNLSQGRGATEDSEPALLRKEIARLTKVLALAAVKGMSQKEQALFLSNVGFANTEIADMLETTAHSIDQTLHAARKEKKKRKARSKD